MMKFINVIVDDNLEEKGVVEDEDDIFLQLTDVSTHVPNKGSDIETKS